MDRPRASSSALYHSLCISYFVNLVKQVYMPEMEIPELGTYDSAAFLFISRHVLIAMLL